MIAVDNVGENDQLDQLNEQAITAWVINLSDTHVQRSTYSAQMQEFYTKRRVIEYGVKATITASFATTLVLGGPPVWLIGGAALMLKFSTICLNRFNPSQYIEESAYHPQAVDRILVNDETLEVFHQRWQQNCQNSFFAQHESNSCLLQKRLGFAITMGFVIFTVLNANLTIPIILASLLYAAALIEQATEENIPYVEDLAMLDELYVH